MKNPDKTPNVHNYMFHEFPPGDKNCESETEYAKVFVETISYDTFTTGP